MKISTPIAVALLSLSASAAVEADVYHAHLNYLQAGGNYVSTDSDLDVKGGSVEFQAQMTRTWIARGGYLQGTDSDTDIEMDQIYGSVGYILSNDGNTAHILELGLSRSEVDVPYGNANLKLDADFYGLGYRYWWHMGRRWEAELDLNAWQAFNADDSAEDDYQFSGQLRVNYYFSDNWGTGLQYKYNEDSDTFAVYVRYVF